MNSILKIKSTLTILLTLLNTFVLFSKDRPQFSIGGSALFLGGLFSTNNAQTKDSIQYTLAPKLSSNVGGFIKVDLYKRIYLETGLSITRRNYSSSINDTFRGVKSTLPLKLVSYEVPITGQILLKLSENDFIGNGLGIAINAFPSDIYATNTEIESLTRPRKWLQTSITGSSMYEHRSKTSIGYLIGITYHRMINTMSFNRTSYKTSQKNYSYTASQTGHYFGIELRIILPSKSEDKLLQNNDLLFEN